MAAANALEDVLGKFASIDKKLLISRVEWGTIDFKDASKDIDAIYEVVELLRGLPLDRLPPNAIDAIATSLQRALVWIERANNFDIQQEGTPAAVRNEIVNNLRAHQDDLYNNSHLWIPFLAYLRGNIPEQLNQITASVSIAENSNKDFQKYLEKSRETIDKIIQDTREAAAEAGVAEFTRDFLSDAEARDDDASTWLKAAMVAAGITIVVAAAFLYVLPDLNGYQVIQFSISKLVLLGVLIGVTTWCAGNFKANKHQASVSRFKANALRTFQAFVQAGDSQDVRDAVLLETTRSIFAQAPSGFLKEETHGDPGPRTIEIVRGTNIAGQAGGAGN